MKIDHRWRAKTIWHTFVGHWVGLCSWAKVIGWHFAYSKCVERKINRKPRFYKYFTTPLHKQLKGPNVIQVEAMFQVPASFTGIGRLWICIERGQDRSLFHLMSLPVNIFRCWLKMTTRGYELCMSGHTFGSWTAVWNWRNRSNGNKQRAQPANEDVSKGLN